jgi:hypothetical protein
MPAIVPPAREGGTVTPPVTDEDEFTELVDADFPRVDLVGKGANGFPRFLIAKQDATSQGLLEPGFVRDLIAKADPQPAPATGREDTVTMTGSPAAIAKLMREGAIGYARPDTEAVAKGMAAYPDDPVDVAKAKAAYDLIVKEKYNTADRKRMAGSGAAMEDGSYPIEDEDDLRKAIHAVGRGGGSHNAIRKHIISRARSLGKSSLIPDDWGADGSIKEKVSKDMADIGPELDEGVDGMDPTVPLAAPDEDRPGDPTDPGSPAWEAIDAATAQKWTSILARAKFAVGVMAEREMLEAAAGDMDDTEHAYDLQDVCCAIDYAISVLAPFAVHEQSEADIAGDAMEAISKAMAGFDPAPLDQFEGLAAVAKAGRVLSASNEGLIRSAAESLNRVLATLPAAPVAEVTKEQETAMAATDTETGQDVTEVAKAGDTAPPAAEAVAKADGDGGDAKPTMQAVFDQNGDLIGIVDPDAITPVAGAGGKPDAAEAAPEAAAEPAAADLTPAPGAETGTPAEDVAKSDSTQDPSTALPAEAVLKSIVEEAVNAALAAQGATHQEAVAKMAADSQGLAEQVEVLKGRLETVENSPAAPRVFANGQVPPAHQLRGQDKGAAPVGPVDVAKAAELKQTLYNGTAAEQNAAFGQMQEMAIAGLAAIHAQPQPQR